VRRLRWGEWAAGAGAALLLGVLFADWFGPADDSGWASLGWLTLAVCAAAIAAGAWLFVATALARPISQVMAAVALTALAGTLALPVLVLRVAVLQPGDNAVTSARAAAYVGLVATALIAVGGWWSMKDERTGAPESAYTPPAPRPAPPAHS
jgi:hypothetical protein